jgi:hypothetical protein
MLFKLEITHIFWIKHIKQSDRKYISVIGYKNTKTIKRLTEQEKFRHNPNNNCLHSDKKLMLRSLSKALISNEINS